MSLNLNCQTFSPAEKLPQNLILPHQNHGCRVVEIITGKEDLTNCDGLWTQNVQFVLGVKTADCASICFWHETRFGILHAGWRGLVNGAVENMLQVFNAESETVNFPSSRDGFAYHPGMKIWVGPLLPQFEIQKDECYDLIKAKFGHQFFSKIKVDLETNYSSQCLKKTNTKLILMFEFKSCLQFLLPSLTQFDERSTFEDLNLASWRRDKAFPKGQNTIVIGSNIIL